MQINSIQNNGTSFGSTYRIPLCEQGITPSKKEALKKLVSKYQNYMCPACNQRSVRLSIRKRLDEGFEQQLKQLGFKVYQKFERHNVPKTDGQMDAYIKHELDKGRYRQFGKQKR